MIDPKHLFRCLIQPRLSIQDGATFHILTHMSRTNSQVEIPLPKRQVQIPSYQKSIHLQRMHQNMRRALPSIERIYQVAFGSIPFRLVSTSWDSMSIEKFKSADLRSDGEFIREPSQCRETQSMFGCMEPFHAKTDRTIRVDLVVVGFGERRRLDLFLFDDCLGHSCCRTFRGILLLIRGCRRGGGFVLSAR